MGIAQVRGFVEPAGKCRDVAGAGNPFQIELTLNPRAANAHAAFMNRVFIVAAEDEVSQKLGANGVARRLSIHPRLVWPVTVNNAFIPASAAFQQLLLRVLKLPKIRKAASERAGWHGRFVPC
jgi:hypothetical protein